MARSKLNLNISSDIITMSGVLDTSVTNNYQGTCTACNKEDVEIVMMYNWQNDDKTKRSICRQCQCIARDKIFGIGDRRMVTEKVLYGEK